MSSGDFVPALGEIFNSAAGLSASIVTQLTTHWRRERDQFAHRSLKDVDDVYLFETSEAAAGRLVRPLARLSRFREFDPVMLIRASSWDNGGSIPSFQAKGF
jgi:hypothetical protein